MGNETKDIRVYANLIDVAVANSAADVTELMDRKNPWFGRWVAASADCCGAAFPFARAQLDLEPKLQQALAGSATTLDLGLGGKLQLDWPDGSDLYNIGQRGNSSARAITLEECRRRTLLAVASLAANPVGMELLESVLTLPKGVVVLHTTCVTEFKKFMDLWRTVQDWRETSMSSAQEIRRSIGQQTQLTRDQEAERRSEWQRDRAMNRIPLKDRPAHPACAFELPPNPSDVAEFANELMLKVDGWTLRHQGNQTSFQGDTAQALAHGNRKIEVQLDVALGDGTLVAMPLPAAQARLQRETKPQILKSAERRPEAVGPDGLAEVVGFAPMRLCVVLGHELIHARRLFLCIDDPRPIRDDQASAYPRLETNKTKALGFLLDKLYATTRLEEALVTYGPDRVQRDLTASSARATDVAGLQLVPSTDREFGVTEARLVDAYQGEQLRAYGLGFWRAVASPKPPDLPRYPSKPVDLPASSSPTAKP